MGVSFVSSQHNHKIKVVLVKPSFNQYFNISLSCKPRFQLWGPSQRPLAFGLCPWHHLPGPGAAPARPQPGTGCPGWVVSLTLIFRAVFLAVPELLTAPALAVPREGCPVSPVALGSPSLAALGTPRGCSGRRTMGWTPACCIYEIIVENHQSSAGKCLHAAWHCFLPSQ